jgi:DNA polymerase III epsilon subunit-like protein
MGITEIGFITIHPDGDIEATAELVDPERTIDRRAAELTGIYQADVRGKPTWSKWAQRLHVMAADHVIIGYNCRQFDCVVIQRQNARYGVEDTAFTHVLDAR